MSNATLSNAVFTAGKFGQALAGGAASIAGALHADKSQPFYIEFFSKVPSGSTGNHTPMEQAGAFKFFYDGNSNPQLYCPGGASDVRYYSTYNGQWHHVYLRFKGANGIDVCFDGVQVAHLGVNLTTSGYNPTSNPLTLLTNAAGGDALNGAIDMLSFGLGDKYANGIVIPQEPINTLQKDVSAMFLFDGNGNDSAGTTGTGPNGAVDTQTYDSQTLILGGPVYNNATAGTAYLSPATSNPGSAMTYSAPLVISNGRWTVEFDGIDPGSYSGPKLYFTDGSSTSSALFADAFSILSISNGGDLAASTGSGTVVEATTISLAHTSSGKVNVPTTVVVGTDSPLNAGESVTITLSAPSGSFSPSTLTLDSSNGSKTTQFTPLSVGTQTITATATGNPALTSATYNFNATSSNPPPTGVAAVTGVTVTPATATVAGGSQQQFTATVQG